MRSTIAGCLLAVLTAAPAPAQAPTAPAVDADRLLRDVQVLAADDMEGRLAGSPGGARARDYLRGRLREAGVAPIRDGYDEPFAFSVRGEERHGVNLLGIIRGTALPDRYIVLTAHYDHLGTRDGEVYNGADDNASGVAALLAVAARFAAAPPRHSLLVALLDAEEEGLEGAKALLRDPPVPLAAMAVNVNIDMVGRDPANTLYAVGTRAYPFLRPLLAGVAQPPVTLAFGHEVPGGARRSKDEDWTRDSDHAVFHDAGIPFVYFGVEDYDQHHRATDDAATIGRAFLAGSAATVVAAVQALDTGLEEATSEKGKAKNKH
jgi:Zn-dependent M28 family amino/carboxypeptidase